ncbi:MAG: transporter substrate-binding domain-containing protein [Methylococcaceae bacterium]
MTQDKASKSSMILLCVFLWSLPLTVAGQAVKLSALEQAFILQHPLITLGTKSNWQPYVFIDNTGIISGIDTDILNRINALTGANFQLRAGDFLEMQIKAKNREIDGLSSVFLHQRGENHLIFSNTYLSLRKMLLVAESNPKNIQSKSDMQGKTVVILRGSFVDEAIANGYPETEIIKVDNLTNMIEMVITGKADATFGNGELIYKSHKYKTSHLQPVFVLEETSRLAFGIRKDWPEAVSILNKGLISA